MNPALLRGKEVPSENLQPDLFSAPEGFIQLIYGRIRQGKSTEAVRRMVEALSNGISVYSNIALDLSSLTLDDRTSRGIIISQLLAPWRHRFYAFDTRNYHFMDPILGEVDGVQVYDPSKKGAEIEWLNTLTDCLIVYDEGQWLVDSYEATYASVAKRKLITETGHMNRVIVIVAQRTQSVHVNARGNVNQFFRCPKIRKYFFFRAFLVEEFQDMKGTDVDETVEPVSKSTYFVNTKYWMMFNTHYLRAGRPKSQELHFEAFDLTFGERFRLFMLGLGESLFFLKKEEALAAPEAREIFEQVIHEPAPSLGDKPELATLKSGERLNTVPAGGSVPRRKRVDFSKLREERLAKIREKEQDTLPF